MKLLQSSIIPAPEMRLSAFLSANAADITTIADGDWALISPYGNFPSPDGTYTQVFGTKEADEVVKTWNSLTGRAARIFKNLWHGLGAKTSAPIWDGHPETDQNRWPVAKLLAETTDLRATANGLEGRVTWNAKGLERRTRGPLYPSPLWWHNPPAGTPLTVHPELLESIGLVATPNISSVPAWTQNATLASQSEAENQQDNIMKNKLITLLGLAATATDDQIHEGVKALQTTANAVQTANAAKADFEAKFGDANGKLTTANATISTITGERDTLKTTNETFKTANAALVKAMLDFAEARGAITPAERGTFEGKVTANAADTVKELATRKAMNTQHVEINGNRIDLSTANARASALDTAIGKRMKDEACTRDEAFAKVQADPQYKALFDAMDDPTKKTA